MQEMENEGGGTRRPEAPHAEEQPINEALEFRDRSPLIAVFSSLEGANRALKALRGMGIANENIGVAAGSATMLSPANDAGTYRATGVSGTGTEFTDAPMPDSFRSAEPRTIHGSPNSATYDEGFEARQYHEPSREVMVSVEVTPESRQRVRHLLIDLGAASER